MLRAIINVQAKVLFAIAGTNGSGGNSLGALKSRPLTDGRLSAQVFIRRYSALGRVERRLYYL